MMQARAGDVLIFGLSEVNMTKLKEGKPITIELEGLGLPGKVFIFYGKTEDDMKKDLQSLMGPQTKVTDRRPKKH
jgi:hypothetical protein